MALSLKINGTERKTYIEQRSMNLRTSQEEEGVFDFTLINPPSVPTVSSIVQLSGTILMYSGSISSITTREFSKGTTLWVDVSCQNSATNPGGLPTDAPFDLSDNPDNVTTFGYGELTVQTHTLDSGTQTTGTITTWREGLAAGQNIEITSANHGLSAEEFTIQQVRVTWPDDDTPLFEIAFGSPLVRLYQIVTEVPDGSITSTKISDGAVTTPKLNANAVIANVANVGGTVTINSGGIFLEDSYGNTSLTTAGFTGTWEKYLSNGLYNAAFEYGNDGDMTYQADPSAGEVPYWYFNTRSHSTLTATRTEASGLSAKCIEFEKVGTTSTATYARIAQKYVPVMAERYLMIRPYWRIIGSGSNDVSHPIRMRSQTDWYDKDLNFLSSTTYDSPDETGQTSFQWALLTPPAPQEASFAQVAVGPYWNSGALNGSRVRVAEVQVYTDNRDFNKIVLGEQPGVEIDQFSDAQVMRITGASDFSLRLNSTNTNGKLVIFQNGDSWQRAGLVAAGTAGRVEFGDGTASPDTTLYRNAANELKTDDQLTVPNIVAMEADDARNGGSASSNYPAGLSSFQITNSSATNWPNSATDARGHVVTWKYSSTHTYQLFFAFAGSGGFNECWYRAWNSNTSAWRAWVKLSP